MIAETKSLTCKLTTRELQERKRTVIADLKAALLERVEIANGMRYKFPGADRDIEKLVSFIKTERMCCGFFTFTLIVSEDDQPVWLELTGPEGVKDFIREEVGF